MSTSDLEMARLAELTVENLLGTSSVEELQELAGLLSRHEGFDATSFERAAAALQLAAMTPVDRLPERLRIRLAGDAADFFGPAARVSTVASANALDELSDDASRRAARRGWYAAAASLLLAVFVWVDRPTPVKLASSSTAATGNPPPQTVHDEAQRVLPAPILSPGSTLPAREQIVLSEESGDAATARTLLLATNRYVVRRSWRPGNDAAGVGVSGDIVWDPKSQRGFMSFAGLRRNNPNVEQYQLWIFDARRDERYPINGGVFDITGSQGVQVVAIKASLKVGVPLMFAVTIERTGGVVVSDRSRIAALANVG